MAKLKHACTPKVVGQQGLLSSGLNKITRIRYQLFVHNSWKLKNYVWIIFATDFFLGLCIKLCATTNII